MLTFKALRKIMTEQEFLEKYAKNSGVTPEYLLKSGLIPMPCDCGECTCQGWQMRSNEWIELTKEFGIK